MEPMNNAARKKPISTLVVDDDRNVRALAVGILERAGHTVLSGRRATEALRIIEEQPGNLDVLLTDFQMPEMTGVELSTAVRQRYPLIKIILMSGELDPEVALRLVDGFVAKPFSAVNLRKMIADVLAKDKPQCLTRTTRNGMRTGLRPAYNTL